MQQTEMISGFAALKDLLIRKYKIERDRSLIRLHFTQVGNLVLLHDFQAHQNSIIVVRDIEQKLIPSYVQGSARRLCSEAAKKPSPAKFLNDGFILYGFFRS